MAALSSATSQAQSDAAAAVSRATLVEVHNVSLVSEIITAANGGGFSDLSHQLQSGAAQVFVIDSVGRLHMFQPTGPLAAPKWSKENSETSDYTNDLKSWILKGDCVVLTGKSMYASKEEMTEVFHFLCSERPKEEGKEKSEGSKKEESSASASSSKDDLLNKTRVIHVHLNSADTFSNWVFPLKRGALACTCSLRDRVKDLRNIPHLHTLGTPTHCRP